MPQEISNKEQVAYIAEATWGTTPVTPTGQIVRYNTIGSEQAYDTTRSAEVTTNRELADLIFTGARGGLTIDSEFSYDTQFEDWMLALLAGSAWTANVAKVGTTRKSFSFERGFTGVTQYLKYLGAIPNKMSWSIGIGNVIKCATSFSSKMPTIAGATAWSATTPAGVNTVMTPLDSIQVMQEGGAGSMSGVSEFTMEIANGLVAFPQLASVDPLDIQLGALDASGTFALYFADATYWTKYLARTVTSLKFTLGGTAAKKYEFYYPKVKLTALDQPNQGINTPIVQRFSWVAYKDSTDTTVKITRTP